MEKCKDVVANVDRANLDVSDTEGNLKKINRERDTRRRLSSDYLRPREVYVLVEVTPIPTSPRLQHDGSSPETNSTSKSPHYSTNYQAVRPLLINSDIVTPSFLSKLAPKPSRHNHHRSSLSSSRANHHRNSISSLSNGPASHSDSNKNQTIGQSGSNKSQTDHHGSTPSGLKPRHSLRQ